MADVRRFIEVKKLEYGILTKVIVAGGSYAGTMATWMRSTYPLHVNGAWASCAPLEARVDFFGYKEIVGQAYSNEGSPACYKLLENAFVDMVELIRRNDTHRIKQEFGLCYDLDVSNKLDVTNFLYGVQNLLSAQVQSARPGSIKSTCDYLTHPFWPNPIAALAAYVRLAYGDYCLSHLFEGDVAYGQITDWQHSANTGAYRTWMFQTCNEFGWYQTTNSKNQPYGNTVPASFSVEICSRLFGRQFNWLTVELNARFTNLKFKGTYTQTKNVYSSHGEWDPWRAAGITVGNNEHSPADVVPGASHTNDLLSISFADTSEMVRVKQRIRELIFKWLGLL